VGALLHHLSPVVLRKINLASSKTLRVQWG
jgi:hypothetical protein